MKSELFAVAFMAGSMTLPVATPTLAQEVSLAEQIVDALNKADGAYPGYRANHAKGLVAEGTFRATSEAERLSKASLFQGATIPVTFRFSSGSGIPNVADGSPRANPHGLSMKFHLPDGSETDMVLNSRKFFPVATGEEFRDLELAIAASHAGEPAPLEKFVAAHPLLNVPLETPASLAEEQYNGLDAFILTNDQGVKQPVRYIAAPLKLVHLTPDEAAKQPPNFLFDEIRTRIGSGPVIFLLKAQLANPDDPITDATKVWSAERKVVTLGTLTVRKVVADSDAAQKQLLFMPGLVTDGIDPSDDPLIQARNDSYAVSFSRRTR